MNYTVVYQIEGIPYGIGLKVGSKLEATLKLEERLKRKSIGKVEKMTFYKNS